VTVARARLLPVLAAWAVALAGCGLPPLQMPTAAVADTACEPYCLVKHEVGPPQVGPRLRFVALGDSGRTSDESEIQRRVAARVRETCAAGFSDPAAPACAFALLLGDNLYPAGIGNDDDRRKMSAIVDSYGLPAYFVLGNHDWGPVRPSLGRAQNELEWIFETPNVYGNAHFYDFGAGPAHLWAIDTNYLVRRKEAAAELEPSEWVQTIGQTTAPWRIAAGHHPYLSNGPHGNAGSYSDWWIVHWRGREFKDFFDQYVLRNVDLYLAGHDHNLQFFVRATQSEDPTPALAIAGSTAKCSGVGKAANGREANSVAPAFESYGPGFAVIDVTADRLNVELHSQDAAGDWHVWTAATTRTGGWTHDPASNDQRNHCGF